MTDKVATTNDLLDSEQIFDATAALGRQLVEGAAAAEKLDNLRRPERVDAVVVLGMGGSGVAGEILQELAAPSSPVPIVLANSYDLPRFVTDETVVFAVSFSGNTEETIAAATAAIDRGSQLVAITSGGELEELAMSSGATVCRIDEPIPQPRVALGAMTGRLLVCCERLGVLPEASELISAAAEQIAQRCRELSAPKGGVARTIADRIGRTFPLVYGAAGIGRVAGRRWKTQINENAKAPAFYAVQPELCHNEVCGFGQSGDVTRQLLSVVELRSDFEHPRIEPRFRLVDELIDEVVADVIEVHAVGRGPLAQLLDLVLIGDFVSLHLAVKEGIDPGPVPVLVQLKAALSRLDATMDTRTSPST